MPNDDKKPETPSMLVSRTAAIEAAWGNLIEALGYDIRDPHLSGSPERVARFLAEWHTRSGVEPPKTTCFPNDNPKVDEVVACGGLRFYSMCAHHGLPFFGEVAIGYIPSDKVIGLSKFARVVQYFAQRFQTQERMTHEIALFLEERLAPVGIGVVARAEHLCMSMRGIKSPNHFTVTSTMRGAFMEKAEARAELLALVRQ